MPPASAPRKRSVPVGQAAVAPAVRDDWCTPEVCLVPTYQILGSPVGIDPGWNKNSPVKALKTVSLPRGKTTEDRCGGLVIPWHPHKTFFNNCSFGRYVTPMWVIKAAEEAKLGAEGIQLLPSYTSAHFFDVMWNNAAAVCFWGKPGKTTSRVKFVGAEHTAPFAILLVYYGPQHMLAEQALGECGQTVNLHNLRRQIFLAPAASQTAKDRQDLDFAVFDLVRGRGETGISAKELKEQINVPPGRFRGSVSRLQALQWIYSEGKTTNTRYFPKP